MYTKLLGIISVGLEARVVVLITFFVFIRCWRKNKCTMRHISYSTSRKPMIQLGGKYCKIFSQFGVPIKLVTYLLTHGAEPFLRSH
jgi:hypothetical protein